MCSVRLLFYYVKVPVAIRVTRERLVPHATVRYGFYYHQGDPGTTECYVRVRQFHRHQGNPGTTPLFLHLTLLFAIDSIVIRVTRERHSAMYE